MNLATVIVLLVVLAFVVLAVVALRKGKNKCSCCKADCPLRNTPKARRCSK
jgi:hypothetical protein